MVTQVPRFFFFCFAVLLSMDEVEPPEPSGSAVGEEGRIDPFHGRKKMGSPDQHQPRARGYEMDG